MFNVHIITSLESGGAQKVLYDYLINFRNRKNVVFSLRKNGFYYDKLDKLDHVKVYYIFSLLGFWAFCKSIFSKKYYVKAWMYHSCLVSSLFKINPFNCIYWSIHHGYIDYDTDSVSTLLSSKICAYLSFIIPCKVIFVSNNCLLNHVKMGFSSNNSIVFYNYINFSERVNSKKMRNNTISFVGRNHPNKNLPLFIDVAVRLAKNYQNIKFLIVGEGTQSFKAQIPVDLIGNFVFYGELKNVSNIYKQSELYVSTSKVESFGLTAIEALSYDCKLILPDIPIFQEVTFGMLNYYKANDSDDLYDLIIRSIGYDNQFPSLYEIAKDKYSFDNTLKRMAMLLGDS